MLQEVGRGGCLCLLIPLLAACGPEAPPTGRVDQAVVNGTPQDGQDATVRLRNVWGGLCSGSLVAPRVVMTAKHCLVRWVRGWGIGFGPTGADNEIAFEDVFAAPDEGGLVYQNEDIAFGILEEPVEDVEFHPIPWDGDSLRAGDDIRLIGYGTTEEGIAGRKYETTDRVSGVGDLEFITIGNGVCGGDSGGTGLDEDGFVVGVIVRGPEDCVEPPPARATVLTRVTAWLDLAREAFDATGACYPTGDEVCDGRDNDCNGVVDDGCDPIGSPCETVDDCEADRCEPIDGERRCTRACDPTRPTEACGPEAHCREIACGEGRCVAGGPGDGLPGDACDDGADCASNRCASAGVCADVCAVGAGACAPGEVCVAEGECETGSCLDASLAPEGPRGLGEPCGSNGECGSGLCLSTEYGRYCSRPCDAPDACPAGYRCERDVCRRGDPGAVGDPCWTNGDCASGVCAHWDMGRACADLCAEGDACPEGMSCTEVGDEAYCEPDRAPTGTPCRENGDCLRGLCGRFSDGDLCTEICDGADPCPAGFECVATTTDLEVCVRPFVDATGGGCRVAGDGESIGAGLLLLLGLSLVRRR